MSLPNPPARTAQDGDRMRRTPAASRRRLPVAWAAPAVAAAAGGWFLLHPATAVPPVSRQVAAVTGPARPLPALAPTFAPTPAQQAPARSRAPRRRLRRRLRRLPTRSTPPDELAGPVPDSRLRQLMDSSYPDQYQGRDRAVVVKAAWAFEVQDLTAGGYTRAHLQAIAVTPRGSDIANPVAVDVTCMWSGSFPVTGWQERRLSTVRLTHLGTAWTVDVAAGN